MGLYTATTLLIVLSLLILGIITGIHSALPKKRKVLVSLLLATICICTLCEFSGVMLEKYCPTQIFFHIIVKTIELSLTPFIGVIPVMILRTKEKNNILTWIVLGVFSINVILEIISAFTGFIFSVDSNNVYKHQSFYFIYLISYALSFVYFAYVVMRSCKAQNRVYALTNIMLVIFMAICAGIQLAYSEIKISWLSICLTTILAFKLYGDAISNADGLTGLFNRLAFENDLRKLTKEAIIIFFDINDFKKINDNYGHVYGDECLVKVSAVLLSVYSKYGKIYRYGGDEFCVILKKSLDSIDSLNDAFTSLISKEIRKDSRFQTVAFGYETYNPEKDHLLDILDKADQKMYENKERHKSFKI